MLSSEVWRACKSYPWTEPSGRAGFRASTPADLNHTSISDRAQMKRTLVILLGLLPALVCGGGLLSIIVRPLEPA